MQIPPVQSTKRILWIDLLRAYAILMMLQGHFIDTMLATPYRDFSNPIFGTWAFFRGITAPVFFFASGLIFVFLLLRDGRPFWQNQRVKKGLYRGVQLIAIGYLIRLNFFALLTLHFHRAFIAVDVLQCIGLALLSVIGVYAFAKMTRLPLSLLLALAGLMAFYYSADVAKIDWSGLPLLLENYFTKDHGSVFTPIPWIGYTLLGGAMGGWLYKNQAAAFGWKLPVFLLFTGIYLHYESTNVLYTLYIWTGLENLPDLFNNNYLIWHIGHIFIAIAAVIGITHLWKNIPALPVRIGSETLLIYNVHFIVLYGTWFGIGISRFGKYSLSPWPCIIGAALFVLGFIVLIAYIDPIREWVQQHIKAPVKAKMAALWAASFQRL
ncbi:MAG: heparan-alpha-glucosaminide N-acetyltransferase domain-containing protein [Bacteroidota bacterium]